MVDVLGALRSRLGLSLAFVEGLKMIGRRGFITGMVLVGIAIFIAPYVAMYLYADAQCRPQDHTRDFCPWWVWSGTLFFPTFCWMLIGVLVFAIGAGSSLRSNR